MIGRKIKGALIDLDGVVYQGPQAIPGAVETLSWLASERIPHVFVTNTTSRPVASIADKLSRLGITVSSDRIVTPPIAACEWLTQNRIQEAALVVAEPTRADFTGVRAVNVERSHAIVLGDLGNAWTGEGLNRIFRRLMAEPRPVFLVLGTTRYWLAEDGLRLDVGAFAKALEHASGVPPMVFGKPSEAFFRSALDKLKCSADETLMIGDDIESDIHGAQAVGIAGALVKTGKFHLRDLEAEPPPDIVLESIAELPMIFE